MSQILDPCCGSKMFYFDKADSRVEFMDKYPREAYLCDGRHFEVSPNIVGDFKFIPFPDEHFSMVVFDPPHLRTAGERSYMAIKYGRLDDDWKKELKQAFKGSVDEFLESEFCYEEVPSWGLRTTEKRYITLDPQRIVEDLEESDMAYEDYEVTGFAKKAIEDFCSAWNTNHAEYAFWGTNIGIVLDEEYLRKVGDEHGTDNQL